MHFREDLKSTSEALSDILKATPKSDTPAVAPDYSERELVVVPSTKPSAPPSTTTVVTTPTSPLRHVFLFIHGVVCFFLFHLFVSLFDLHVYIYHLRAPANLTSMSVPPATIHEPNVISPTKIESVLNASALNNGRKRPRDLCMDGRYIYMYVHVCVYLCTCTCMYVYTCI